MATLIPPPSKKQKREAQQVQEVDLVPKDLPNILIKFEASDTGESVGGSIRVPGGITEKQLEELLNQIQGNTEDPVPYTFALLNKNEQDDSKTEMIDIKGDMYSSILKPQIKTTEDFMTLVYTPRAIFKVKPVTRSGAAIAGHGSVILCCQFAPNNSSRMCSGSGDSTARIWDCNTNTPVATLSGHTNWVLCVAYSPCGTMIATGSMDNTIRLWEADTGKPIGKSLTGHSKHINSLSWEPLHLVKVGETPRLASGSKDTTVKIWDTSRRVCQLTMSGHTDSVKCVKWSGSNLVYSGGNDKLIKTWDISAQGKLIQTLKSHGHWVNHISLSTDYVIRRGGFDHTSNKNSVKDISPEELRARALKEYEKVAKLSGSVSERMVSASDDFTMYLWEPLKSGKPICRMTGHQKLVNHVSFSPDGRYIVSSSFDNSIKIWDGLKGTFIATLRGHVAPVYQTAWSADNRLLVSGSKDTTLKVWDIRTKKLVVDLPGHADEVFAVDWSLDGKKVASGGRDKMIRIWSH